MTAPAGQEKLAEQIAHRLDPAAMAIIRNHVREQCEECRRDFDACFVAGPIKKQPGSPFVLLPVERAIFLKHAIWIDVKSQRAQLQAIEKAFDVAAGAIGREPQEIDWRPTLVPLLSRFVNRLCRRRFIKQAGYAEKFRAAVTWFDLLSISSTELSTLLYAWARLAGGSAQRLTQDARSIPKEDFFAHWSWRLLNEFAPELNPELVRALPELPLEGDSAATDYVAANWSRLSPHFRAAHNRLRGVRGLPVIPPPTVDHHVPPTALGRQRRFPFQKYLTVTGLLAQYVVGSSDMKFRAACLKVRTQYDG